MRYCFLISILIHFLSCDLKAGTAGQPAAIPDSIRDAQLLYNGIVWTNLYYRIKEDQFFLSKDLLQGSVSTGGKTFSNLRVRYDIYNDQIMIPNDKGLILQLNKETTDSFTLQFNGMVYRFENFRQDSTGVLQGYLNVLHKGRCSLYVKYRKEIELLAVDKKYDKFYQLHRIYAVMDDRIYPIKSSGDFYKIAGEAKSRVKSYMKKNKFIITKRNPESFIPAVVYFNTLTGK